MECLRKTFYSKRINKINIKPKKKKINFYVLFLEVDHLIMYINMNFSPLQIIKKLKKT